MDIRKIREMFAKRVKPRADERVDPTPEEIRAWCLHFQSQWGPHEEARRRGSRIDDGVEIRTVQEGVEDE